MENVFLHYQPKYSIWTKNMVQRLTVLVTVSGPGSILRPRWWKERTDRTNSKMTYFDL